MRAFSHTHALSATMSCRASPRLITRTITPSISHDAAGADTPTQLRGPSTTRAHTQIDTATVPALAQSLQNHRGGFIFFSSSSAAPDRCLGVPCARSRDSVGVRVQMQDCGGTHSWCRGTCSTCRGSAADTPGSPGSWAPNGRVHYARVGTFYLGSGSCPSPLP